MNVPVFGESIKARALTMTSAPIQVEVQGRLGVDADAAFAYVTDARRLSEWLPIGDTSHSDDSRAESPGGVGSVRVIRTGRMPETRETVVALDRAARFYAYSAADAALMGMFTQHLGVIGVEAHPDGGCVLTWLAYAVPGRSWLMRYVGLRVFRYVLWNGTKNLEKRFPVGGR